MKRLALLSAIAATLLLAVVAAAAPPPVDADAYVVQNSGTGEVLAAQDEHEHLPMASITKLMTAIVALEHASLDDVATVSKRTAAVGESTINLVPGERVTLRDLIRAALIQSANDAANAIAAFVGHGSVGRFVGMMNARARQLGLTDTHFANPDGLDAPGHYSSAADVTKLARVAMNKPFIRETVRLVDATAAGRQLHNWNDLLATSPNVIGVKTGHTDDAGWSQVAAARGGGVTIYATILGGETREGRNADLSRLLVWGLSRYRTVWAIDGERVYGNVPHRLRQGSGPPRRREAGAARRPCRAAAGRARRHARRGRAARPQGPAPRRGPGARPRHGDRALAARRRERGREAGCPRTRRVLCGPNAPPSRGTAGMIVTVTLNAALDRTLTVPNFQRGQRHRASQVLTLAGGKGINIARALKRLDVPVVATGLAGGRTGTRIVEELTAEAILNDFVRIGEESRTSTAVVDPTEGSYTEINEWGPKVTSDELETLLEKLHYLSRGADFVVFAGSLPRGVEEGFYAEAIRDLNRRGVHVVLDTEGEPLRLGIEAEPWLVSPNQREAEHVVGQELEDEEDFLMALDTIAELGARNVLITLESGCYALFREDRAGPPLPRECARERRGGVGRRRRRRPARAVHRRATSPASRPRTRSGSRSPRARPRRSRSAPAASTRATPAGWSARSRSSSSPRSASPSRDAVRLFSLEGQELSYEEKFGREGLTFDDVLLVPAESSVLPNDVRPRRG